MTNINLVLANKNKKDEFYTQIKDIENELRHYKEHFKDKTIFCNCDDHYNSNFFKYFADNFISLGLKRLIATGFPIDKNADVEYVDAIVIDKTLRCDYVKMHRDGIYPAGDFRSKDSIRLLERADIVVTNPPFSLFREYLSQLVEYNKQFIIIGNVNAISYKEVFPLIKENKLWLGASIHSGDREFMVPNSYPLNAIGTRIDEKGNKYIRVKGVRWFTNVDYNERHEDIDLHKEYNPEEYPKYDNYDAINVNKTADIPYDYDGFMGVPITFLDKYNPIQFEIVGIACGHSWANYRETLEKLNFNPNIRCGGGLGIGVLKGKAVYARILIRKRKSVIS